MRRETHEDPSHRYIQEEDPKSSSFGYEHSAISSDIPCSISNFFMERKKGDMPKENTLGDYLLEYEVQSEEFKGHLNFQGFFKMKEEKSTRSKKRGEGRLFLSNFDGSRLCRARAWVKELDTFVQ